MEGERKKEEKDGGISKGGNDGRCESDRQKVMK